MAGRLSNAELEELVRSLVQVHQESAGVQARELLVRALGSDSSRAQTKAVEIIGEQRLEGYEDLLLKAFEAAMGKGAKGDPGCGLKLALAEALDFLDCLHPEPFLQGVVHRQMEASWGKPEDSAGPLRSRCGLALVRLRYPRVLDILADLLCDTEVNVRSAAAGSVAYHGDERGTALLRLKLGLPEPEPDVTTDTLKALLALDAAQGLVAARRLLEGTGAGCHGALLALGESRVAGALELLLGFASRTVIDRDVQVVCLALGSVRGKQARSALLEMVATGSESRVGHALEGLALIQGDPMLAGDVRAAEARNPETAFGRLLERLFPE
ncbi:MAG: HEAT repeat protein [Planctomycetota bacterium]|jgi:HEAT repeat protein